MASYEILETSYGDVEVYDPQLDDVSKASGVFVKVNLVSDSGYGEIQEYRFPLTDDLNTRLSEVLQHFNSTTGN